MMQTKTERFTAWRKVAAKKEKDNIDAAILFDNYIKEIITTGRTLDKIKQVLGDPQSPKYKGGLEAYGRYPIGALVYCKLEVDEALDELLAKSPLQDIEERMILRSLSSVLGDIYQHPTTQTTDNITLLLKNADAFLMIKPDEYADKKRAKALYHSIYATFTIINAALGTLGRFARPVFARLVLPLDINNIEKDIKGILATVETNLPDLIAAEESIVTAAPKTILEYLNDRHLALFNGNVDDIGKVILDLNASISEIRGGITRLIEEKNKKISLVPEIERVTPALPPVDANDEKHLPTEEKGKAKLLNRGSRVISFFDKAIAKHTHAKASGSKQISITTPASAAPDRNIKTQLAPVEPVSAELLQVETKIKAAAEKISGENTVLQGLLIIEPVDNLQAILDANVAVQIALVESSKLFKLVKDKMDFLTTFEGVSATLRMIVKKYNGIFVAISNFLVDYLPRLFSKSKTATMIDKALAMQAELADLKSKYTMETSTTIETIAGILASIFKTTIRSISSQIKKTLYESSNLPVTKQVEVAQDSATTKQAALDAINSLRQTIDDLKPSTQGPTSVEEKKTPPFKL